MEVSGSPGLAEAVRATDNSDAQELAALVQIRHASYAPTRSTSRQPDVPNAAPNEAPDVDSAMLEFDVVSTASMRDRLARYGCALAGRHVGADDVVELRDGIDRAFDAYRSPVDDRHPATAAWFTPFEPPEQEAGDDTTARPGAAELINRRAANHDAGSMWAVDSPAMLARLLDVYERLGVIDLVSDFFGERPAISMNKCTLRRLEPDATSGDWHQDGAFMGGQDMRSLNVWLALSDCGQDAPGMDLVPTRLPIVETGTPGAWFKWSVSPAVVDRERGGVEILRPDFGAGDLLFFDHRFLHRTAESATKRFRRYAIETWFFPPSQYPDSQVPIAV